MDVPTYHIVWTTYGTWLPGDARGWIKAGKIGIQASNAELEKNARMRMTADAVVLTSEQQQLIDQTIRTHCHLRNWPLHALNVRSNHVHAIISAYENSETIMKQLKAWCSRKLSDQAEMPIELAKTNGRRRWFTEGGDAELITDDMYFHNAVRYVIEGQ